MKRRRTNTEKDRKEGWDSKRKLLRTPPSKVIITHVLVPKDGKHFFKKINFRESFTNYKLLIYLLEHEMS